MHALAHEEVWGTLCVMRSSQVKALHGEVMQLYNLVLSLFFGETHDIRLSGVSVSVGHDETATRATIFARVGVHLADEPALKELFNCKGHAGIKPCCLCVDATAHNTGGIPLHVLTGAAVSIANPNWDAFTTHSDESIRAVVERINIHHADYLAGRLTKGDFDQRSMVLGWNWAPDSPIVNAKYGLNIASTTMFDWAHVYVHDGLADVELGQIMKAFHSRRYPTTFQELGEYVDSFSFPKAMPTVSRLFNPSANVNNARKGSFTCTGSEFMTLTPVLHRYFDRVVRARGQLTAHVESMLACLSVVMLLMAVRTGEVSASELFEAVSLHLRLYQACYGDICMRPKHHYALHLPDMLRRFGFLLATFTHERKHRLVMRYTRGRSNLKSWDLGAIEDITCHQVWELKQEFFLAMTTSQPRGRILLGLRDAFPGVADAAFTLVNRICGNGGHICPGDVVSCLVDGEVQLGEYLLSVGMDGMGMHSLVALWKCDGALERGQSWVKFAVSDDNVVKVSTTDAIDSVFTHRMAADRRTCVVYFPPEVRAI